MATATTRDPGLTRGKAYVGLQHYAIHYSSIDTETVTPGVEGIVHCAWEPDTLGDAGAATVGSSTEVAFVATSGPHAGTLHVWARA